MTRFEAPQEARTATIRGQAYRLHLRCLPPRLSTWRPQLRRLVAFWTCLIWGKLRRARLARSRSVMPLTVWVSWLQPRAHMMPLLMTGLTDNSEILRQIVPLIHVTVVHNKISRPSTPSTPHRRVYAGDPPIQVSSINRVRVIKPLGDKTALILRIAGTRAKAGSLRSARTNGECHTTLSTDFPNKATTPSRTSRADLSFASSGQPDHLASPTTTDLLNSLPCKLASADPTDHRYLHPNAPNRRASQYPPKCTAGSGKWQA